MSKASDVRWGRWVGAFAGVLVLFKSAAFVLARLFSLGKNEVQARGHDVNFVLGMVERRAHGRR
jgi:hypothetical protein